MNKNTKRVRRAVQAGCRRGDSVARYEEKSARGDVGFVRTVPCATVGKGGVVSQNRRRNTQMVVSINRNGNGAAASLTSHEPIDRDKYITHKNHSYENFPKYFQTMQTSSRPVVA